MRSLVPVLGLFLISFISCNGFKKPYNKCYLGYTKIGCFKENLGRRGLNHQLLNERDPRNPYYDGHRINWKSYGIYIKGLACRCAARAKELGLKYFGLQFYGECWGGKSIRSIYRRSNKCWQSQPYRKHAARGCNRNDLNVCVGGSGVNYVYRVECKDKISNLSCRRLKLLGQCKRHIGQIMCCKTCH